jgi:hypothetical protein
MKKLIIVDVPDDLRLHIRGIDNCVPANHIPLIFKEIKSPTGSEIVTILLTELKAVSQKEIQAVRIVLNHLTK